jgi:hypothetical protein
MRKTGGGGTLLPLCYWRDATMMALTPEARDLYVRLLSYSADELTDGDVPTSMLNSIAAADASGTSALEELKAAGLICERERRTHIVEWETYNLPAADVEAIQIFRRSAGQKGGLAAAKAGHRGRFKGTAA